MSFVGADDLVSFVIHAINIIFISIVELVHLSNKVISFVSESSQILLKSSLLVLRVYGSLAHHLQLLIEIPKPMAVTFMLSLKFAQLIIFSEEVCVDRTRFSGDVFASGLLVPQS